MANAPNTPRGPDAVTHQLPAGELPAGWNLLGGQYEITRLIASGGFGITYLARDTLGRDVAVKECFPLGLAQRQAATHTVSATSAGTSEHFETARAQFLREARMLAALRHPNVVHVQTLFEENGTAYMAMDFIHGRDLQEEMVAEEAMTPPRILDLARDLLGALEYIHAQSVLHRDIKPQNIRIDRFGMPMLIDFGAARAETQARSRMAGTFRVVTDGYSPHEFYVAGAAQGPHSDLYALAATLHHAITGAAPSPADERASALATGQSDPYEPIADRFPGHDGRLLQLIDCALRMAPKDRPATASVWLQTLADAPTTLITPSAVTATAPARTRLIPGIAIGGALVAIAGAGIWAVQPPWLAPEMGEMSMRMGLLEQSLEEAEVARAVAEADLEVLQTTLLDTEANLARLSEGSTSDMAATMAELDAAHAARDVAAAEVAALQGELAVLASTQSALEQAQADRDAAQAQITAADIAGAALMAEIATLETAVETAAERDTALRMQIAALEAGSRSVTDQEAALRAQIAALEAASLSAGTQGTALSSEIARLQSDAVAAAAQIAALETDLSQARTLAATLPQIEAQLAESQSVAETVPLLEAELSRAEADLAEVRTTAARLPQIEADLTQAQADLASATARLRTLEQELQQARTEDGALGAMNEELGALSEALAASEVERIELLTQLETANTTASATDAERAQLQNRIEALEAEADDLRIDLSQTEAILAARVPPFTQTGTLRAPNGSFALLPRFSWNDHDIAAVDSEGGIALYDRETGAYRAHLARGLPDDIRRLGFSSGGAYLIATTANGTPNRLYDIAAQREIMRFDPATVTTADRAISSDERWFVYTREAAGGAVEVVRLSLQDVGEGTAQEVVLTTVPSSANLRVSFAETRNDLYIVTADTVEVYDETGTRAATEPNRMGQVAAMAPIGQDNGILVLRRNGDVMIFDDVLTQVETAQIAARATYSRYRLSGNRLNFLRANADVWEVINLLTGEVRGSGEMAPGYADTYLSLSADGSMIFMGAAGDLPARLVAVSDGAELQLLEDASEGYFSFDNMYLTTGALASPVATIWRLDEAYREAGTDLSGCVVIDRAVDAEGVPVLPATLPNGRIFSVQAGGDVALTRCAEAQDAGLTEALAGDTTYFVPQAPAVSINMFGSDTPYTIALRGAGDCDPVPIARFGDEWRVGNPALPRMTLDFADDGSQTQFLDIWLATTDGESCDALITLSGSRG